MTDSIDFPAVYDHIKKYGLESIEMEFKFGKVSKQFFDRVYAYVASTSCDATYAYSSTTRNEFNGTDARREFFNDGTFRTVYKKRLENVDVGDGLTFCVSLEREGADDTSVPYSMYRTKHRDTFCMLDGALKIDLTRVETNDPRYADSDDYIYEVELEVDTTSPGVLFYPLEYIVKTAHDVSRCVKNIGSQCK